MEPKPPLDREFMRDSSPLFDWEVQSIEKREAWSAGGSEIERGAEALQEARRTPPRGPTSLELVLQKLTGERNQPWRHRS